MQRRGSQSSMAERTFRSPSPGRARGGGGGSGGGDRQRRGSQSSMTERTFRSPSPGRSRTNSFTNNGSPVVDAPPVPTIPKSMQQGSAHQRSLSMEPPQRVYSPGPYGRGGRTNSMDRSTAPPPVSTRKGMQLADVNESELERSDSQRKKNISQPQTSQPTSPTSPSRGKAYTHGTGGWYAEPVQNKPTSNGGPGPNPDQLAAKMARIQSAQGQSVKKDGQNSSSQGAQLKTYTQPTITGTAVRPQARPQQATETVMVYDSNSRTFVPQIKTKSAVVEPPSPTLPPLPAAAPGTYDPHTRTIVPVAPAPDVAPPPRNPARLSPTTSPRNSYLQHQPSTVHEDPEEKEEEEEEEEGAASLDTPTSARMIQTSVGPAKSYVSAVQQQHQRSASLDVPSRNTPSIRGRQVSASPSPQRKTHFSASPVSHATRHDPPPRDISPAKSALKNSNSPAPSARTASPLAHFSGQSMGPGSDVSSVYSQDGISSMVKKKKKSARVSFDEQPHEIEVPAAAPPKVSRARSPDLDDSDDEDFSKPRPVLPTFGSIRKNREVAEKVTEMAPDRLEYSNDHAIGSILHGANGATKLAGEPMPPVVTSKDTPVNISDSDSISDVGDLGEYVAANAAHVNLPEQTAEQAAPIHEEPSAQSPIEPSERSPVEPIVRDFASVGTAAQKAHDPSVPHISLLPPTPGTEEFTSLDNRQSAEIVVPGGWSAETETDAKSAIATTGTPQHDGASTGTLNSTEEHPPILTPIDEDTDTDDAEFSDAAEDPSEFEGGFASLDAIAVSPITVKPLSGELPASPIKSLTSPPDSPTAPKALGQSDGSTGTTEDKSSGDWTSATAYWSQLSRQQRAQIERDHMSSDDEARPSPAVTKKTRKTPPQPISTQASPRSVPAHRIAQPAQPALKNAMRTNPAPVESNHSMRKSMRDGGGLSSGSLRSRSSSAQPAASEQRAGALVKKTMRPQSSGPTVAYSMSNGRVSQEHSYTKPVLTRPVSSTSTTPAPPVVSQRLQKELLNHDSDSESSFRKKKRSNSMTSGGMSMKRSMRGGLPDQGAPAREQRRLSPDRVGRGKGKDSFSIRSLSPTGSIFGRKKAKDVRNSIRGSSVASSGRMTTMRTAQPAKTMRQTPAPAAQKASAPSSRFKSRFADSDDSDDDAPPARRGGGGGFRSRFADSDEEDADVLTPVRGIPRRSGQDDGDSTDLDDSDAEGGHKSSSRARNGQIVPLVPDPADVEKAMAVARKNLGITSDPPSTPQKKDDSRDSALAPGSPRTSQPPPPALPQSPDINSARKKSFMGGLLRRNRNSQQSVMTVSGIPQNGGAPLIQQHETPTRPQGSQRDSSYSARPQSPTASPGKLIRRASGQPHQRMVRGDSTYSTATAPPMMGESSIWPSGDVPPVPAIPADLQTLKGDGRPATSDGQGVRFSEDVTVSPGAYSARTGRKKKFGMLRRAFGLHD